MKKKGLIISTVVMVVVLIASLTTATYAWFTASSAVTVNPIDLTVRSSAVVSVGVKTTTGLADSTANDYMYSDINRPTGAEGNTVSWEGGITGLGQVLNLNELKIVPEMALGTASGTTGSYTVDSSATDLNNFLKDTPSKTFIKAPASSTDDKVADSSKAVVANANVDYLDATIGVAANKDGIKGMYVKVVVTANDTAPIIGMNAAIHIVFQNYKGTIIDVQPFGSETDATNKVEYKTQKTTGTFGTVANDADKNYGIVTKNGTTLTSTFYFWVATSDTAFAYDGSVVKNFRILMYIDGADTDCNSDALGSSANVAISFDGTEDVTKLSASEENNLISTVKFLNTAASVKVGA